MDMKITGKEIKGMELDVFHNVTTDYYDIKRRTTTADSDGAYTTTWAVIETRKIEIQATRFSAERSATIVTVNIGGESFIPSYRGWIDIESDITATDRITANSGTTDLFVLRTYDFEAHKEIDLKEVKD